MAFRRGSGAEAERGVCSAFLWFAAFVLLTLVLLPLWTNIKDTAEQDGVQGVCLAGETRVVTWVPAAGMDAEFRPSV